MYNFGKKIANAKINLMRANASFKRLLIYKTKRGNFHQLQLTYVPDYDYLEKNHFDASANQIDKIKDDFSGYIEYSTIKDERKIFILRFEKGKLVGKIQFKSKKELNPGTNAIQNAKSSKAASMSIKEDINVVSSGHFETECIPIMLQPCFEVGDPPVETCGEWIQVGENCDPVWVEDPPEPGDDDPCYDEYNIYICDPENPDPDDDPPLEKDCAGVESGTATMSTCGCIGGTTGIENCSKDPCDEVKKMDYQNIQSQLAQENTDLASMPNDKEYGTEENLSSVPGNDYMNPNIRSTNTNSFKPQFSWNDVEGHTIGFNHKHTNGTGPSPADIMTPYEFSARTALINSGQQDYYKDNMTVNTISGNNNYKMTIRDWGAVATIYGDNTAAELITKYQNYAQDYLDNNPNATLAARTEYAMIKIFGSSINFYKKNSSTGKYEPYKIDSNGDLKK